MSTPPARTDRYSRMLPSISDQHATIIGVGAVGRQIALTLASMGVASLTLIDPDTVEPPNLGTQGYREEDLYSPKVVATKEMCRALNVDLEVNTTHGRFTRSVQPRDVVFCCVDSIQTRSFISDTLADHITGGTPFIDGRMSAETCRILTAASAAQYLQYTNTLFAPEEAYVGGCTAQSTYYCAAIAANLMVAQWAKHLRGFSMDPDINLNILAAELSAPTPVA